MRKNYFRKSRESTSVSRSSGDIPIAGRWFEIIVMHTTGRIREKTRFLEMFRVRAMACEGTKRRAYISYCSEPVRTGTSRNTQDRRRYAAVPLLRVSLSFDDSDESISNGRTMERDAINILTPAGQT